MIARGTRQLRFTVVHLVILAEKSFLPRLDLSIGLVVKNRCSIISLGTVLAFAEALAAFPRGKSPFESCD